MVAVPLAEVSFTVIRRSAYSGAARLHPAMSAIKRALIRAMPLGYRILNNPGAVKAFRKENRPPFAICAQLAGVRRSARHNRMVEGLPREDSGPPRSVLHGLSAKGSPPPSPSRI